MSNLDFEELMKKYKNAVREIDFDLCFQILEMISPGLVENSTYLAQGLDRTFYAMANDLCVCDYDMRILTGGYVWQIEYQNNEIRILFVPIMRFIDL